MSNEMLLRISRRQLLAATGGLTGLAVSGLGLPLVSGSAMADTPQKGGTLKLGRVRGCRLLRPRLPHGQHVDLGEAPDVPDADPQRSDGHQTGPRPGGELGSLGRQADLHLPSAEERGLFRRHAGEVERRQVHVQSHA